MPNGSRLPSTETCLKAACQSLDKTHVAVSDYDGGLVSIVVKLPDHPYTDQAARRLERAFIKMAKEATRVKPLIVRLHA
jgi:hypothetical protein